MYRLAYALGCPIEDVEAMPVPVFFEWMAFFQINEQEQKR